MTLNEGTTDRFVRLGPGAGAALLACWQQRPGVTRVAAAAAAATFAVHAVREAIYLSPGHGSQEPAAH